MVKVYSIYTCFLLVIFVAFGVGKPVDLLPDMLVYKLYFESIKSGDAVLVDSSFVLLSKAVLIFSDSFRWIIFFYVTLSLLIKIYCFKFFRNRQYVFFMYVSSLLLLHEFIQIRIALSLSFLLFALVSYFKGRFTKSYFLFLVAIVFHISAIIFVAIFFFCVCFEKRRKCLLAILPIVFVILVFLPHLLGSILFLMPEYIQNKLSIYIQLSEGAGNVMNILSVRMLVVYLILFLFFLKYEVLEKQGFLLFSSTCILIITSIAFRELPDLSFRLVDLSIFFSIFLIADIKKYYKNWLAILMCFIFVLSSLYTNYKLILYVGI